MFKPLPIFIALGFLRGRSKSHFVSFITWISVIGLVLGVAVLTLVLSVMNGFEREFKERILGIVPQASLHSYNAAITDWQPLLNQLTEHPQVLAAAPQVQGTAMLTSETGVKGVLVNGIDPDYEAKVSIMERFMPTQGFAALNAKRFSILMGEQLAEELGVGVGDSLMLILPEASATLVGVFPRVKRFYVQGLFDSGSELDRSLVYVHVRDAAKLFRVGQGVESIRLRLEDPFAARQVLYELLGNLSGDYWGNDWTRSYGNLYQAIQLSKSMNAFIMLLIVGIAAFNIVSTLVMVVMDKQSSIAIMRTMGFSARRIGRVFILQGFIVGLVGTLIGLALGVGLSLVVDDLVTWLEQVLAVQFLNTDIYFINEVPSQVMAKDVLAIFVCSVLLSSLATLYPSRKAAKVQPALALNRA